MTRMPRDRWPDSTLLLLHDPYRFISKRCHAHHSSLFETGLMLEKTICMSGREATELFYDSGHFVRRGAMPAAVIKTLFGRGGVQGLDDQAHRQRKEMFMALMSPRAITRLSETLSKYLSAYARIWSSMDEVVIYDQLQEVLSHAACEWAGIPVSKDDMPLRTRQLTALFDHAGSKGFKHFGARLARHRSDAWVAALVGDIRDGRLEPRPKSVAATIARYRDADGRLLDTHTAAVELLNILRPIVAVSVYITFLALALHSYPECRIKLLAGDTEYAHRFVQEVRRYYPFFPMVAARVREEFVWHGYTFPQGRRVLLDLFGTNHDARYWGDPEVFRPERFSQWQHDPFAFIPQGGGDYYGNHRCPGEWIVISLMEQAVEFFARRVQYQVPAQDLRINYRRMPALPRSRFVISDLQVLTTRLVKSETTH